MSRIAVQPGEVLVLAWDGPEPRDVDVLEALGADGDAGKIDVFAASKIAPVGMVAFLSEGHGIAEEDLRDWADRLDALRGTVVVLPARALAAGRGEIDLPAAVQHVATFREAAAAPASPMPLESAGAKGTLSGAPAKAPKSDARIGGMVALAVLLFLAVFVIVFVGIAG